MSKRLPWPERFWIKVDIRGPDECWPWNAFCSAYGYGNIYHPDTHRPCNSHVVAWCLANEKTLADTAGFDVCHKCDNPPCCNPSHLWLGTRLDNVRDMIAKGRAHPAPGLKGEKHGMAKFTEEQVAEIRSRFSNGESKRSLAEQYGVHRSTIYLITTGKHWKMVGGVGSTGTEPTPRGTTHYSTNLTEDDVRYIRSSVAGGLKRVSELAKEFCLNHATISMIVSRKNWKHVQ